MDGYLGIFIKQRDKCWQGENMVEESKKHPYVLIGFVIAVIGVILMSFRDLLLVSIGGLLLISGGILGWYSVPEKKEQKKID